MHAIAEKIESYDAQAPSLARTRELAMSAAWNGGLTRELVTSDGLPVRVVFRGHWSHGFGPDFSDAMLQIGDTSVQSGAVEIHRLASDWTRHGHHLDPRYNDVILHVVTRQDTAETRCLDGTRVPVVVMDVADELLFAIDQQLPEIWDQLGGSTCAEDLAKRSPERIRTVLARLGDERFTHRTATFEGELTVMPLESVMLRGMVDAFGYSENRAPMRMLLERLTESGAFARIALTIEDERREMTAAMLFGFGGFLPLTPNDAHLAGLRPDTVESIEQRWLTMSAEYGRWSMPATSWVRARTRPANHPAARVGALANLLAATHGDPTTPLIGALRRSGDPVALLRHLTSSEDRIGIGAGRATAMVASVVLPVAMAWARHTGDGELEDAASHAWAILPRVEWSRPAKRALAQAAGAAKLGRLGERANQGLLHLDRALCTPRRCFECPIAADVVRDRQRNSGRVPAASSQSMEPT